MTLKASLLSNFDMGSFSISLVPWYNNGSVLSFAQYGFTAQTGNPPTAFDFNLQYNGFVVNDSGVTAMEVAPPTLSIPSPTIPSGGSILVNSAALARYIVNGDYFDIVGMSLETTIDGAYTNVAHFIVYKNNEMVVHTYSNISKANATPGTLWTDNGSIYPCITDSSQASTQVSPCVTADGTFGLFVFFAQSLDDINNEAAKLSFINLSNNNVYNTSSTSFSVPFLGDGAYNGNYIYQNTTTYADCSAIAPIDIAFPSAWAIPSGLNVLAAMADDKNVILNTLDYSSFTFAIYTTPSNGFGPFALQSITSDDPSLQWMDGGEVYIQCFWRSPSGSISAIVENYADASLYAISLSDGKPSTVLNAAYPYHLLVPLPLGCIPLCEDNP